MIRGWLEETGSTHMVGLLRISLAALIWSRWAAELAPFRNPSWGYWALAACFYLSTTGMFFGIYSRISTAATALVLAWMVGVMGWYGGVHDWIHHHTHLLLHATILLALTPCGRSFSWDAWRTGAPQVGPLWGQRLIALQCSAVYLFSAIDKTTVRFLSGDHLQGILAVKYTGSDPVSLQPWLMLAAIGVVALEYVLPFGLFVRRWQWILFPIGLLLHGILYIALPVGTFSLTMWALYLAYVHPDDADRFFERLLRSTPS